MEFTKNKPNFVIMTDGLVFFVGEKKYNLQYIIKRETKEITYNRFFGFFPKTKTKIELKMESIQEEYVDYSFNLKEDKKYHFGDVIVPVIEPYKYGWYDMEGKHPGYRDKVIHIPVFDTCEEAKAYKQEKLNAWEKWWEKESKRLEKPEEVNC